ncbi:MAG: GTP-binding and nucleic acid-binding protein YchF [uncultured Thermomicrobiales bacterium]|uniref:Ribosome-binding ATPase YchF n=1 Tax=uncultured Thermomicrobiales bacterium TaxID=1645740 RepID=A0A6J4TXW1_9BACT|nr:MAG: GTP-binding and nucleic acid-binding protein YchF [uncultured Thermomicrobiales bacterium]
MATQLVIIGLPSSGKTTVFNALTRAEAQTGTFGASGDEPNLANVKVPDPRLDRLTELFQPQRKVPADVQYLDVAGIAKGIAEKGMGGQLLGHLSQADALVHVVRAFEDANVAHAEETVDPARDIETLNLELTFSDLGLIEKRLQRLVSQIPKTRGAEREAFEREQVVLTRLKAALENDTPIREVVPDLDPDDAKVLRGFGFLSAKPLLVLLNLGEDQLGETGEGLSAELRGRFARPGVAVDAIAGQIEMEIGRLDADDAAVFMADLGITESSLGRVIRLSFELLGLIPFFTVGPDECRAWTIRRGETAVEAAAAIHSDIQRGFIRAEVVAYDDLIAAGSLAETKRLGTFRREGKAYVVQDGDTINFLFNV